MLSCGLYVCLSSRLVTLVHPAKAVGRDELPFGRDTLVVQSNNVLDRVSGLPRGKGRFGGWNLHCDLLCVMALYDFERP